MSSCSSLNGSACASTTTCTSAGVYPQGVTSSLDNLCYTGPTVVLRARLTVVQTTGSVTMVRTMAAGAGTDAVDMASVPPQVTVCNAFGHEGAIGEYVVMAMMAWCHEFPALSRALDKGFMRHEDRANLVHHDEIDGKTVGVLSLGRIGDRKSTRLNSSHRT